MRAREGWMFEVKANEKPKWHQIRWKLSNLLIYIARKIKPDNPEVKAFIVEMVLEQAITGNVVVKHQTDI
jgi:hypothetical protein